MGKNALITCGHGLGGTMGVAWWKLINAPVHVILIMVQSSKQYLNFTHRLHTEFIIMYDTSFWE